ncbi:MAG: DNA repair protein RecN [bacterium]|nr:DNA repair protein RecN [bacterium]
MDESPYMLTFLSIKDLALIRDAELAFDPGFTVLTGETGAGKSIIISAIELLLGARADSDSIRSGCETAHIRAVFTCDSENAAKLERAGVESTGEEVILSRTIAISGRNRNFINETPVAVKTIRSIAEDLVELHGQFSELDILRAGYQTVLLDEIGDNAEQLSKYRTAFFSVKKLWEERESLARAAAERDDLRDSASFKLNEIEAANLREGEEEELRDRRRYLQHAVKIIEGTGAIQTILAEGDYPVIPGLAELQGIIAELVEYIPELSEYGGDLKAAAVTFEEINRIAGKVDSEVEEGLPLETVESRLAELERLKRKYDKPINEIIEHKDGLARQLEDLTNAEDRVAALEGDIAEAEKRTREAASALSQARVAAAEKLKAALLLELPKLGMASAEFVVEFDLPPGSQTVAGLPVGPTGAEEAVFMFTANPGEQLRPLNKVASGGELSRVMLAIRAVAAERVGASTIIFDEVDVGVGGRVAHSVGKRLSAIAQGRQVVCVTHLPQIAARADHQYFIEKRFAEDTTRVNITKLEAEARVEELARMLGGGKPPTETTLSHARELLAGGEV